MSAVTQSILSDLVNCTIKPGEQLLEVKAAKRYATSRTKVREALIALSSMGMVKIISHKGAIAAPLDPAMVYNVFEARIALEKAAAALAAARMSPQESERLSWYLKEVDEAENAQDLDAFDAIDRQVSSIIVEQSRNPLIQIELANLRQHSARCWNFYQDRGLDREPNYGGLRQIIKSVSDQKPDLASAATHLYLLSNLKAFQDMLSREAEVLKWV